MEGFFEFRKERWKVWRTAGHIYLKLPFSCWDVSKLTLGLSSNKDRGHGPSHPVFIDLVKEEGGDKVTKEIWKNLCFSSVLQYTSWSFTRCFRKLIFSTHQMYQHNFQVKWKWKLLFHCEQSFSPEERGIGKDDASRRFCYGASHLDPPANGQAVIFLTGLL